jgi:deferrochelatase/peroxidase EfeB
MAVGRFEDGTPIVLQPGAAGRSLRKTPAVPNDFNYSGDPQGLSCPFQAHTRKSNPRLESVKPNAPFADTDAIELGHRIARRGIPYGGDLNLSEDPDELPEAGVGLLFMCYQSNIENQFEFIQRFWCDNPNFLRSVAAGNDVDGNYADTGIDPIIGQILPGVSDPVIGVPPHPPHNWPKAWGHRTVQPGFDFPQVVTMRGGEYFFTPSLTFLKGL